MKFVCTTNLGPGGFLKLTPNKIYFGHKDKYGSVVTRNDDGYLNTYSIITLKPINDWRKEKLIKVFNESSL